MSIPFQVTFDAGNPAVLAEFWAIALGYVRQPPPDGFESWEAFAIANDIPAEAWGDLDSVVDPAGEAPRLLFQRVPEGKTAKNRVHLDVSAGIMDSVPGETPREKVENHVERLVEAGATLMQRFDRGQEFWIVMADPEGNEFCVQ